MNVADALAKRHSTRAFMVRDVEMHKVRNILHNARRAPSGANTQPWRVAVVRGTAKRRVEQRLIDAYRRGNRGKADYEYYPVQWTEPYKSRRFDCGMQLYASLGIEREEKERRTEQWVENYRAFGAPVALFFYIESHLETGSYMDCGMFLQSIMLAALNEGLATCPQAALAEYPEIVRQELDLADNTVLLCGMALGYEDTDAPINQYRTTREEVDDFTTFYSD